MSLLTNKDEALLAKHLYKAIKSGDTRRIFIILRDEKANPNFILEKYGIAPFHFVIGNESKKFAYEATKLMLLFGADPNVRSEDRLTPVHVATAWNRTAILHQLLKAGGNPFLRDEENKSAVDYALEKGLTKALQIINYHASQRSPSSNDNHYDSPPHYTLTLEKVYLYRDNVRAEYSARPEPPAQRRYKRKEEVFRHPDNLSSSETSGADINVTHRITIPPSGNIRIESSVKSDDEKTVRHQCEVDDKSIKRTILTYLQDCQVYECVVPSDSSSSKHCHSKENQTPERGIKSYSSSPNHKTPSSVNFSSLCNNLAKELHEKLTFPQPTSSNFNVSIENQDLYQTCVEPENVEVAPCCSNFLEPCSNIQKHPKKCVRNIFHDMCNTSSPSRRNVPCSVVQKSICEHCQDIFCNNFKIICYHFCDSPRACAINREGPGLCANAVLENSSDEKLSCTNDAKNLIGFERVEKTENSPRVPLKSLLSPNSIKVAAPCSCVIEKDSQNKESYNYGEAITMANDRVSLPSGTPNKKLKVNSSLMKNRAKLEKAFLSCLRKNPLYEVHEKGDAYSHSAEPAALTESPLKCSKNSNTETNLESWPSDEKGQNLEVTNCILEEHSNAADSSFSSFVDCHQSLTVDVLNKDSGRVYPVIDLSSPKKCNICDYQDETDAQIEVRSLTCDNHSCSETKKNRFSLPVSASPVKLDNCVELHFVPKQTESVKSDANETSPPLDNINKSSSTFKTVVKVSSKDSSSSDNNGACDVQPNSVILSGSVESLTNISELPPSRLSNSPENSRKTSVDEGKEIDATNCLNTAFCSTSPETDNAVPIAETGLQSGRNSCQSEFSEAFFSSSERCSRDKMVPPNGKNCESSPDYFSSHELTRSYWTSDEEPSFLGATANDAQKTEVVMLKRCSRDKDECGFDAIMITSDEELEASTQPKFNVCEEYKYVDKEKDVVFRETRFKSSTVSYLFSSLKGTFNGRKVLRQRFMRLFRGSKKSAPS